MRKLISKNYEGVEGGLFSKVTKADVGERISSLCDKGVIMMCWADPFVPDPSIPDSVKLASIESILSGYASHYKTPAGFPDIRDYIVEKCAKHNGLTLDKSRNIVVTPGSDTGLFYAMSIFIDPGDEVLIPDPSYPNNALNVRIMGGVPVAVPLDAKNNYRLDIDALEAAVTEKTKLMVLTHPNNPTTTVFRRENLVELSKFLIRHDLALVVDQAFEDIVFDDIEFVTPASLPGMWERTVSVFSVSKGYGLSGYRVGYIVANDVFTDVYLGAKVNVLGAVNIAAQAGVMAAMKDPSFMDLYKQKYDYRRKVAYELFNAVPGVSMEPAECSFFCWLDVSRLGSSAEITENLLTDAMVAVNDGVTYGACGDGHLRIIHGAIWDDDKAVEALTRIANALRMYAARKGIQE